MSDIWTNLLSGVIGAIVGGAASLAGTVLVNRMQMATSARMRMYDELLPQLERALKEFYDMQAADPYTANEAFGRTGELLMALERASSVAGRRERAAVRLLVTHFGEFVVPVATRPKALLNSLETFSKELTAFSGYLGAKLG